MTERYRLELYIIRDNELEFALLDKEAENSQGTTKMVEKKLNRQDKRIKELEQKVLENNCDNCIYSKAIYADVECRKIGLTNYKFNCDGFEREHKGG